eukprot:GHVS01093999.1.p1 GENE.GHVS01093999.1~~GHVS01093999.1.p1  ORF type:complete len:415 (-),score=89.84 GHVS01093999.1:768-2012(-)
MGGEVVDNGVVVATMKLRIRTLNNDECEVDVDAAESITSLKAKVQVKLPTMEASRQKLIHAGKILSDEMKISDYPNIQDNDRVVVMVTKTPPPKPSAASSDASSTTTTAASSSSSSPAPASTSTSESSSAAASTSEATTSTTSAAATTSTAPASSPPSGTSSSTTTGESGDGSYENHASALLTGTQLEETISNIEAMGFGREQIQAAMRAAFNNPDRAVEYLTTGIPEVLQHHAAPPVPSAAAPPPPPAPAPTPMEETGGGVSNAPIPAMQAASPVGGGMAGNPLEALTRHPHFDEIRRLLQSNPAMVPSVVASITEQNPTLGQMISSNPDAFMALVNQPGRERQAPPGTVTITLTEAEMESINRLQGLGFPRSAVQEAFLACDRNEEMAANYLFENAPDFGGAGGEEEGDGIA